MKLAYYAGTDSLCIDLSKQTSVSSREISERIVLDCDSAGQLVGIDIDNASRRTRKRGQVLRRASNSTHGAGTIVSSSSRVSFTSKTISGWLAMEAPRNVRPHALIYAA